MGVSNVHGTDGATCRGPRTKSHMQYGTRRMTPSLSAGFTAAATFYSQDIISWPSTDLTCFNMILERHPEISRHGGVHETGVNAGEVGTNHGAPRRHGVGCAARGGGDDETIRLHDTGVLNRTLFLLTQRQAQKPLLSIALLPWLLSFSLHLYACM